jgi:hypothetical protein
MRSLILIALMLVAAVPAYGQAPEKPDNKTTLSAEELEMMADSVEQLDKAAQDMQTANLFLEGAKAKQERAAILIEARKLKILNARGFSDETHEVAYIPGANNKPGQWIVREKQKPKAQP